MLLLAVCCLVSAGTGCEALQRKFTRKPKTPTARPVPIAQFQDYSKAMTPMERYRKHYLIFGYWNAQLLDALAERPVSAKRVDRLSTEAFVELETMQRLLSAEAAQRLEPIVTERLRLNRRLHDRRYLPGEMDAIRWTLEVQTRRINREFFWRDVEDHLAPDDAQGH